MVLIMLASVVNISMALARVRTLYLSISMKMRYMSGRITGATSRKIVFYNLISLSLNRSLPL